MCYIIAIYDDIIVFFPIVMYVVSTPNHEYLSLYLSDFLIGPINATPIWKSCFWRINTLPASRYQLQRHFRASSHFKIIHSIDGFHLILTQRNVSLVDIRQISMKAESLMPIAAKQASKQASEPATGFERNQIRRKFSIS